MGICRDVSGHVGVFTVIQGYIIVQLCDDLGFRSLFLEESRAKRKRTSNMQWDLDSSSDCNIKG